LHEFGYEKMTSRTYLSLLVSFLLSGKSVQVFL
jgi:hypothetical protein